MIPPRYRSTYFAHIFAHGYSAGYYSYIWSEVLDADTVEWFKENGGMRRENGDTFRRELLSRGGSVDSLAAYEGFRGRAPEIAPLLTRRGLVEAEREPREALPGQACGRAPLRRWSARFSASSTTRRRCPSASP